MQFLVPIPVTPDDAYASGDSVGGKIDLSFRALGLTSKDLAITDILVIDKSGNEVPYDLHIFDADLDGTVADKTAYEMDADDMSKSQGWLSITENSAGIIQLTAIYKRITLRDLSAFAVLIARGAPTFDDAADLSLKITAERVNG